VFDIYHRDIITCRGPVVCYFQSFSHNALAVNRGSGWRFPSSHHKDLQANRSVKPPDQYCIRVLSSVMASEDLLPPRVIACTRRRIAVLVYVAYVLIIHFVFFQGNSVLRDVTPQTNKEMKPLEASAEAATAATVHQPLYLSPLTNTKLTPTFSRTATSTTTTSSLLSPRVRSVHCRPPLSSGFHNQILQLARFLASSCGSPGSGDAVRLPQLRSDLESHKTLAFDAVFDAHAFAVSLQDSCLILVDSREGQAEPSALSCSDERVPPLLHAAFVSWVPRVYGALRLSPRLAKVLTACQRRRDAMFQYPEVGSPTPPSLAVHFRCERDWQDQAARVDAGAASLAAAGASHLLRHSSFYTPAEIAATVKAAGLLGDPAQARTHPPRVFVIGAVDRMLPKYAKGISSVYGVWGASAIVVSAHRLGCMEAPLSYTERAALETFLAIDATAFVGHHMSSFFEGVSRMRQAARKRAGVDLARGRELEFTYACSGSSSVFVPNLLAYRPLSPLERSDVSMWDLAETSAPSHPSFSPLPASAPVRVQFDRLAWEAEKTCVLLACGAGVLSQPSPAAARESLNPATARSAAAECIRRFMPGPIQAANVASAVASVTHHYQSARERSDKAARVTEAKVRLPATGV
jgi:hypothetical protein